MFKACLLRVAVVTSILVVFAMAALVAYAKSAAYRTREDAEALLLEIHALRIDKSTTEDIVKIAGRHAKYRVYLRSDNPICSQTDNICYFDFVYRNTPLSSLRLAPPVEFGVRLQLVHNLFDVILFGFTSVTGSRFIGVHVMDGTPKELIAPDSFHISRSSNEPHVFWVRITADVSPQDRERAYSLGMNCLDQIGGCTTEHELMPAVGK
jgi:hypothetical protein